MKHLILIILYLIYSFNIICQIPMPDIFLNGSHYGDNFGYSCSNAGDVNGDGYDDVIVGANSQENGQANEGFVYIYHGGPIGLSTVPATVLESNQEESNFGFAVNNAGDVNNDGYDDVIVGAYYFDDGQVNEGKVFIYHGSPTGINPIAATTLQNNQAHSFFGYSVASGNDVNNDGFDDVIVGAINYDNGHTNEGRAYLFLGSSTGINVIAANSLEINQLNALFGSSLDGAGDVNGDGFDDIIIGAADADLGTNNEGVVYIYQGNSTGVNAVASRILDSDQYYANFGYSVSGAGDINQDGYDDIVISAINFDNGQTDEGKVFIFHGSSTGIPDAPASSVEMNQEEANFGNSVSSAGDFNNDGNDDIIIGSYRFDNGQLDEGKAFIYFGSEDGLIPIPALTVESDYENRWFAICVSSAGDINGDGFSDIICGANLYNGTAEYSGAVLLYEGSVCASTLYYADYDGDGFGNQTDSFFLCNAIPDLALNSNDCNDYDEMQNPTTIWYIDIDLDQYYSGSGSPINQCDFPSLEYSYNILGGSDCDDLNFWKNPGVDETPDLYDNNCNGLINENMELEIGGILQSNQINSNFGYSLANIGDVNLDGFDDLIIGADDFDEGQTDEGKIFIYYGSSSGLGEIADATIQGNTSFAGFGGSVDAAGDVNGDGYPDVVIGAPNYGIVSHDWGRLYIYYGSASGLNLTPATTITPGYGGGYLGRHVSPAGDVNNDGFDDIFVSSLTLAAVYYGSITGISSGSRTTMYPFFELGGSVGTSFSGAGDINGDGYDDVLVGNPYYENGETNEGGVGIYYGSSSGIETIPTTILENNSTNAFFGNSVSSAGDVNNDGYFDIIVGAPEFSEGASKAGRVYIFLGSNLGIITTPQTEIEASQSFGMLGKVVSSCGDLNLDGYDDIIVNSLDYDYRLSNNGRVTIYHGSPLGIDTTITTLLFSDQSNSKFGTSLSGTGDYNNDGLIDVIIGSPEYTLGELNEGVAFKYYGTIPCLTSLYYLDFDGDSFGDIDDPGTLSCIFIPGSVENNLDCDDLNSSIKPSSPELCNSLDDNCNGLIDDAITETISISAGGPITFCQGGNVLLTATYSGATVQWKKNGTNIPGATSPTYLVNSKGTYTCETTSPCDTELSTGIFVNVQKNPPASITAGGATTFCAGGSVILTANTGGGLSYQWYKGASLIAGATSINYTATIAGNYKCRVTKTATGCFKNSNVINVSVPCKEGELVNGENAFTIYPNPNDGTFTIEAVVKTQNFVSPESTIEIYNNLGQLIYSEEINSNDGIINETIELKNIVPGIYLVNLWNNNFQSIQNIIIE